MDPEKYLVKLSLGKKLTEAELGEAAEALERIDLATLNRAGLVDEAYALVHLISKAGGEQYAYLVARYLEAKDPLLVSLVLETLCLHWGLSAAHLERVMSFALGESWDYDEDVRQTALKILGEHLRRQAVDAPDKKAKHWFDSSTGHVMDLLFSILGDAGADQHTRRAAYSALCRAAGKEWEELPADYREIDFSDTSADLDRAMLEKLREAIR